MLLTNENRANLKSEIELNAIDKEEAYIDDCWGSPNLSLVQARKLKRAQSFPNMLIIDNMEQRPLKQSSSAISLTAVNGEHPYKLKKSPKRTSSFEEQNFSDYGSQEKLSISLQTAKHSPILIKIIEKLSNKITQLERQLGGCQITASCLRGEYKEEVHSVSFVELDNILAEFFSANELSNAETAQTLKEQTLQLVQLIQKNEVLETKILKLEELNIKLKAAQELKEREQQAKILSNIEAAIPSANDSSEGLKVIAENSQGCTRKNIPVLFLMVAGLVSTGLVVAAWRGENRKLEDYKLVHIGLGLAVAIIAIVAAAFTYIGYIGSSCLITTARPKTNLSELIIEGPKPYYYRNNEVNKDYMEIEVPLAL